MSDIQELVSKEMPGGDRHPVHRDPIPHIRRETKEPLKSWSGSYQPIPMPRLIFSPYVGCDAGCNFCFIQGFPGLYRLADDERTLTVFKNYPDHVHQQLNRFRVAPPAILSPYTDPFQPINDRYELSEQLVKICAMESLPLDIVTRFEIPEEIVAMLKHIPRARIQVSVDAARGEGSVPDLEQRLEMVEWIRRLGIEVCLRLDPIAPGGNEFADTVASILERSKIHGVKHVVTGFLKVPPGLHGRLIENDEDYKRENSRGGWWSIREPVKRNLLESLRSHCNQRDLSLGVLGSPDLQDDFGDYRSPFPNMLPISKRRSSEESFSPVEDCPGDCLRCPDAVCGISELRENREAHRGVSTSTWDRWGQSRNQESLIP